jgi:hypothetical protein
MEIEDIGLVCCTNVSVARVPYVTKGTTLSAVRKPMITGTNMLFKMNQVANFMIEEKYVSFNGSICDN